MLLKKLSQSFKVSIALIMAVFSSGLMQPALANAATQQWTEPTNHPAYWENLGYGTCNKTNWNGEDTSYQMPAAPANSTWSLLVLKGGQYNETYENPVAGQTYMSTFDNKGDDKPQNDSYVGISHIITCYKAAAVTPTGTLTVNTVCEGGSFSGVVTAPENGTATYTINGSPATPGTFTNVAPGEYTIQMFVNSVLVDSKTVTVEACEQEPVECPANQVWFDQNENEVVDEDECFRKVFVCKYVGTPGVDERLQTGNNPISVSVHAIANNGWDGTVGSDTSWFSDGQDRSYVLAYDDRTGGGQEGEPDVSECPAPETPEPQADIDAVAVCTANGIKVTLTNSGDADGTATVNGTNYEVTANDTREVIVPFALGTPFMANIEITVGNTTILAQNFNCAPGQGGGQTLGSSTTKTPSAPQVLGTSTALPAALPSTGGEQNPMLILLASLMAYGIAYLFQGRRQLNQTRA